MTAASMTLSELLARIGLAAFVPKFEAEKITLGTFVSSSQPKLKLLCDAQCNSLRCARPQTRRNSNATQRCNIKSFASASASAAADIGHLSEADFERIGVPLGAAVHSLRAVPL